MVVNVGDVFAGFAEDVKPDVGISIRTTGTQEATVHNIYYSGAMALILSSSDNEGILFDSDSGAGVSECKCIHVTFVQYIVAVNQSKGPINIAWDEIYTKGDL